MCREQINKGTRTTTANRSLNKNNPKQIKNQETEHGRKNDKKNIIVRLLQAIKMRFSKCFSEQKCRDEKKNAKSLPMPCESVSIHHILCARGLHKLLRFWPLASFQPLAAASAVTKSIDGFTFCLPFCSIEFLFISIGFSFTRFQFTSRA